MIPIDEARQMVTDASSKANDQEAVNALADIFKQTKEAISDTGFAFVDHEKVFIFNVDRSGKTEDTLNFEMDSKKFYTLEKTQMFVEVFYEPYLYDIELSIISNDAINVRSHKD